MKTFFKLLIVVLILNAVFQAGRAYVANYQFEDDMQQVALFAGPRPKPEELLNRVIEQAEIRGLPVSREAVDVTQDRIGINISATYSVDVTLVPRLYTHTFVFQPKVSARLLNP